MGNVYNTKTISSQQLMYAAAVFVISSNLLTKSLYPYTKNQTWIAVVLAAAAGLFIVSLYGQLAKSHDGAGLFEINEAVFGVWGGKLVSAAYVFYFLTLTVFNTRDFGAFVNTFVLPGTPLNLVYALLLLICVYAVSKGADKMMRYGALVFYIYVVLLLFIAGLLIPRMHLQNFLPILTVPLKNQLIGAHMVAMLPYCEVFVFLTMSRYLQKPASAGPALRRGMMIGALVTLFLVARDIAVQGSFTLYTSSPTFTTIRMINVADILTRLEIINSVFQMILLFFKVSILLYGTVKGFTVLFNIERHERFSTIFAVLVLVCAGFFFVGDFEHQLWQRTAATYATFFLLVLPVATLAGTALRRNSRKTGGGAMKPPPP